MPSSRRFSPRDWSLRVRLAVVLLVPGILAVVLGGLRIADQTGEAAELDRVARFATAQGAVAGLVEQVAQERYAATTYVAGGRTGDAAALQSGFGRVTDIRAALEPVLADLYPDDPALVGAVRQADQAIARLSDVRGLTLTSAAPASAVAARYTGLVSQLSELDGALLRGVNSTEVNGLATGLSGLTAARNEASLQYALVASGDDSTELAASDARMGNALADFRTALDPGQRVRYGAVIAGPANTARAGLVQGVLAAPGTVPPRTPEVFDGILGELDAAEDGVRAELTSTAQQRGSAATALAGVNAVLLLLALLVGAVIVGLIARAMLTSLRTLRSSAMDVAERRLPEAVQAMRSGSMPDVDVEPVPVTSREEVGEVARAFDAVHSQAVRLAAEQATLQANVNRMFVNLSRRSQTLVDRQLQLIEALESNEQDPDQLSSLFRLDHLATRMRRNSENLLVLAGTDLTKRSAQHVPVIDVLQAAVSEVERYERITVESPPPLAILGRAANDVQHLLSELLDNATNFSPPDAPVRMSVVRSGTGPLVVEITDTGVGMPPDDLAEANRALARRTEVGVTASRRMGLFVVARLAARHGIDVRLVTGAGLAQARVRSGGEPPAISSATGDPGITARVAIPAHLVVGATPRRQPPAAPQSRPPQAAPHPQVSPPPQAAPPRPERPSVPEQASRRPSFPVRPDAAPTPAHSSFAPSGDAAPFFTPARSEPPPRVAPVPPEARPVPAADAGPDADGSAGTPIFEEVTSGWFRSYRHVPITWQDGAAPDGEPVTPAGPMLTGMPQPRHEIGRDAFASPADDAAPARDVAVELDANGLPQRTPGAQLVPGSVPAPAPPRQRDPEAVRDRLTGYHRGTRTGRDAADGGTER
ncbi:hypothetical protein GCM10017691_13020 [Pseudonocardia petroleophila]|uniref:histidine kinase n=1 Tax=Pseudonocardia petroleophila TaxID=37331 RepID=A0A7G7MIH3_9PSEU|nr:nitrate- and nitrite sensing domain-containing protein [Pseudonocardia petroleophila]QNG52584.1 nitrate- and nitrite sensing domain-containing protein [Pseudonocardia petroleophila]